MANMKWLVFDELIQTTGEMFKSINEERERRKVAKHSVLKTPAVRGNKRLRWTDPW